MSTTTSAGVQDRARAAILQAATQILAERGDATMADIADAANVGRTTLYRYFPTREALLTDLHRTAVADAVDRLASAGLDTCPVDEGIARALRALLAVGDRYVVLTRERVAGDQQLAERELGAPLLELIERGRADATLRDDVPAVVLLEAFGGAVSAGIRLIALRGVGLEDASAYVTRLFLAGAARER